MYCIIKCTVHGNQARVKNADLHHPSCTVVMYRRKSASPIHNVLTQFSTATKYSSTGSEFNHTQIHCTYSKGKFNIIQ